MITDIQDYFRALAATSPHWNFVWLYDPHQMNRVLTGLWMTVKLSLFCLVLSVVIGIAGAWAQGAKSRILRGAVQAYVQFFRNTPPLLQLLFFYFALGQFTPSYSPDGWLEVPIISNVGWAIISLSFFAGAFNIEIFRAGIESVPHSTREAAESLGMTRLQTYTNVVFPLAFRISMPALSANLVNLIKTTNQAFAIAVPELLYQSVSIWNDFPSAQNPTMLLLLVCYLGLVGILSLGMGTWERKLRIPAMAHKPPAPMPVLLPFTPRGPAFDDFFAVRWLAAIPFVWLVAAAALFPALVVAQSGIAVESPFDKLVRWMPFLFFQGFLFNVLISALAMVIGTVLGAVAGLGLISRSRVLRGMWQGYVSFFRNIPWLVLLFIVLLAFPFQITVFGTTIPLPGWMKTVIGLAIPVSANIAEVVRGAIQSVPTAQWEGAESLGFTRRQTIWQIIMPQCFKRMLPPWMNWYAILTMSTPLCSLLGVSEIISLTRQAMEAEGNRPELLMPFYGFALILFLAYCYPIARLTMRLERRFAVKN